MKNPPETPREFQGASGAFMEPQGVPEGSMESQGCFRAVSGYPKVYIGSLEFQREIPGKFYIKYQGCFKEYQRFSGHLKDVSVSFRESHGIPGDLNGISRGLRAFLVVTRDLSGVSRGLKGFAGGFRGVFEPPRGFQERVLRGPKGFHGVSGVFRSTSVGLRGISGRLMRVILQDLRSI